MKPKEIDNLRKSIAKKTIWTINICMVVGLLVVLWSAGSNLSGASMLAKKSGTTWLELPNYDLSGTFSGVRMKANEKLFMGILHLFASIFMIAGWILTPCLRRRNRRIIKYIDGLENETNQRIEPTRDDAS